MVRHLVGLQAQENLPPYLSLAARLTSFDPRDVTAGLEDRTLVRFLTMRGTVHLLVADDALSLRQWTAPVHEREIRISQSIGPARDVDRDGVRGGALRAARRRPAAAEVLGAALAQRFPDVPATQLGQLARSAAPLVQCPPRGTWKGSGGVVYQYVDRWLGRPLVEPDVEEIVRRYLRAFGPATAADVTAWSGRHPARTGGQGDGRPGHPRGRAGQAAVRRARAASSPTRTPRRRSGCSASTTTSGSRTPAVTG